MPGPRRKDFFERTLSALTDVLEQSLFAEEVSQRKGLLQNLDPRVKAVSIFLLLVSVGLSRSLPVLAGLNVLTLALAWFSSISLGFFLKRVWLFIPFFTGMVALPALFLTPGPALAVLPLGLTVTQTGLRTVLFLLLRVSTSVSLGVLLVLTTAWPVLLKALAALRIPEGFLLILGMTYRYIHLLLRTSEDMFLSRRSRIVGRLPSSEGRRILAASVGTLLGKSLHISSEVYLAMESRGYDGSARSMAVFSMRRIDWVWGCCAALIAASAVWLGR
jgi:cobalt/nickel transport system permease protein